MEKYKYISLTKLLSDIVDMNKSASNIYTREVSMIMNKEDFSNFSKDIGNSNFQFTMDNEFINDKRARFIIHQIAVNVKITV